MTTTQQAQFDRILDLEDEVRIATAVGAFRTAGESDHRSGQNLTSQQSAQKRLNEALDALTFDEMVEFGQYRKAARA